MTIIASNLRQRLAIWDAEALHNGYMLPIAFTVQPHSAELDRVIFAQTGRRKYSVFVVGQTELFQACSRSTTSVKTATNPVPVAPSPAGQNWCELAASNEYVSRLEIPIVSSRFAKSGVCLTLLYPFYRAARFTASLQQSRF